jgi:hypothetical protein
VNSTGNAMIPMQVIRSFSRANTWNGKWQRCLIGQRVRGVHPPSVTLKWKLTTGLRGLELSSYRVI